MADNPRQAAGPLVVAAANPRYFTVASGDGAAGKAVYLTGSHIWNNLHDGLGPTPDNVEGHPFHAANNGNGIAITSIVDYQVLPLDPRVQALQEAYIRQVVDTVHDLPNVLYEVANESSGDDRRGRSVPRRVVHPDAGRRLHAVAVLGDRLRQAARAADGVRQAPRRDDDAVPRPGPEQGQRPAVQQLRGLDLTRLRRPRLHRSAGRRPISRPRVHG